MRATKTVTRIVPALTARTQFGQILRRVKTNLERFVVDRRGEPEAVIMSVEDYLKNFVKRPGALARRPTRGKGEAFGSACPPADQSRDRPLLPGTTPCSPLKSA